jgi:hypothetical protein
MNKRRKVLPIVELAEVGYIRVSQTRLIISLHDLNNYFFVVRKY